MPNQAPNPSFEVDLSSWEHASGTAPTMSRVSTGTPFHGVWSMEVTANATANVTVRTPVAGVLGPSVVPTTDVWSVGAYGLWVTGTPKAFRCDLRWMANATTEAAAGHQNGSSQTMNTSTWTQSKVEGLAAPSDATSLRIRFVCVSATVGDVFRLDGIQMEKAATLPAFDDGSSQGTVWTRGVSVRIGG